MVAEKTWFGSDGRVAARRHNDGSDSNGSGANMDLWQRMWQDGSNSCDNTVVERNWLGSSIRYRNDRSEMVATVAAQTWLTGPGGSGNRKATATSRQ